MSIVNFIATSRAICKRVKSARMLTGLSRKDFSQFGISAPTLSSWESITSSRQLTEKGANRLVQALYKAGVNCSVNWLLNGVGAGPSLIDNPIHSTNDNTIVSWSEEESIFREIEFFKEINASPTVLLVQDKGMEPFFNRGDYVAGNKKYGDDIDSLKGLNCIIETNENEFYVRRLEEGRQKGLYTLSCLTIDKDITNIILTDVAIKSAAEIVWHRKRST